MKVKTNVRIRELCQNHRAGYDARRRKQMREGCYFAAGSVGLLAAFAAMYFFVLLLAPAPAGATEPEPESKTLEAIHLLSKSIDADWAAELAGLIDDYWTPEKFPELAEPGIFGAALCFRESSFNPKATNSETLCAGLFQIAPLHNVDDIYDPEINCEYGAFKLRKYIDDKGSVKAGLIRYGTGTSSQVKRFLKSYENLIEEILK